MSYEDFIAAKRIVIPDAGFEPMPLRTPAFPFQRQSIEWAVRRGRAALFEDTGLGKTLQYLEWARQVSTKTKGRVLILAPLAVSHQTVREGQKFGIELGYAREQGDEGDRHPIVITNYERLGRIGPERFIGVVLDESSILKSYSGTTKQAIIKAFERTPYKLACTATPAPNDHLELGNHAEFLGVMSSHEMIARWFINDTSTFGTYRLKGHAVSPFWDWVSSWAVMASKPSDLGPFDDSGYVLPKLNVRVHEVDVDMTADAGAGTLFRIPEMNATSIHTEKRRTTSARAARIAEVVAAERSEKWIVWTETDYEADALMEVVPGAVEIRGSEHPDKKEAKLIAFSDGEIPILVTKPKLAGYGLNWQHVARQAFVGATFSFESFYQAIRRTWRFGQKREVDVHVAMAPTERPVWEILQRKATDFERMKAEMFEAARRARQEDADSEAYRPQREGRLPMWMR